jgi:hypothetical protein
MLEKKMFNSPIVDSYNMLKNYEIQSRNSKIAKGCYNSLMKIKNDSKVSLTSNTLKEKSY